MDLLQSVDEDAGDSKMLPLLWMQWKDGVVPKALEMKTREE